MKKIYFLLIGILSVSLVFGQAVQTLDEGFETVEASGVPAGWISVDDGDGFGWRYLADGKARTGSGFVGTGGNASVSSNDWLITPQVEVTNGFVLSFWYRAGGASWPDTITVKISKAGTGEGDFSITLDTVGTASEEYAHYSVVLTDHPEITAGDQVYIGLNYTGSGWYICVDDFAYAPAETLEESFEVVGENGVPQGWTSIDDGDGYPWRQITDGKARSGDSELGTGSYYPAGGGTSNDWVVTPMIQVVEGNVLSFWYRAGGAAWPDTITVNVSKTGTSEGDFSILLDTVGTNTEEYMQYSFTLSDHPDIAAGDRIYIGLNYIGSGWFICVDDFRVGEPEGPDQTDASLSDLTLDGLTVRGFDPDVHEYYIDLGHDTDAIPVAGAVTGNPSATFVITDAPALPGTATVEVKSQDESVTITYTIHFRLFVIVYSEGFETGIQEVLPESWTVLDADSDGFTWYRSVGEALTDSSAAACYSYTTEASDDWLISPGIPLRQDARLTFYARVGSATWPESFILKASVNGMEPADFTVVIDTIKALDEVEYAKFEFVLTDHEALSAGDSVYLAFQRISTLAWYMLLDDVRISVPLEKSATLSDLRLNGTTLDGFQPDIHEYTAEVNALPAVEATATNESLTPAITMPPSVPGFATVMVTSEDGLVTEVYTLELKLSTGTGKPRNDSGVEIYPQPAGSILTVSGVSGKTIRIFSVTGRLVKVTDTTNDTLQTIEVSDIGQGIYFIQFESGGGMVSRKISIAR